MIENKNGKKNKLLQPNKIFHSNKTQGVILSVCPLLHIVPFLRKDQISPLVNGTIDLWTFLYNLNTNYIVQKSFSKCDTMFNRYLKF